MDPLMRKLFQPREAREKLRGMGGIMSSSPQLASTVAKFNVGGDVNRMLEINRPEPQFRRQVADPALGRSTQIGGVVYTLLPNGAVIDARTGERASPDATVAVMQKLGAAEMPLPEVGVNPSFTEDRSDRFVGISDLAPMSEPAVPTAPSPSFDMSLLQDDLAGVTKGLVGPALRGLDDRFGDSVIYAPANDTTAAEAAIDRRISGDIPTPTEPESEMTFSEALRNRPGMRGLGDRILDDIRFTSDAIMTPLTGSSELADEEMLEASRRSAEEAAAIRDAQGITESLGRPAEVATDTVQEPDQEPSQDSPVNDDQGPPPENLDLNDPATFDTTYDQMLTRLQRVMGTKDEDSREKAMANLAMIGLAIASGQSPDALTNIAQGALTGVKAIREEQAAREEQDKALRMAALNAALEQEQGIRSAEATAARDELKFRRDLALEREKARLGGGSGGGRDPRAIEDFSQNTFDAAFTAASSASPPVDMAEGETPSAYAERITRGALQLQQIMFPETYGANTDILNTVRQALDSGTSPDRVRQDFLSTFPGADPSYYGL